MNLYSKWFTRFRCVRNICTTPVIRFEANTRVLQSQSLHVGDKQPTLRDLWYKSMYGTKPVTVMSYNRFTKKFVDCPALVVAKGKNTVEELMFTCGGLVQVRGTTKFCLNQIGPTGLRGAERRASSVGPKLEFVSNELLAPKDELFTVQIDQSVQSATRRAEVHMADPKDVLRAHPTRILMSHSYRVEDTFEILIDHSSQCDNWIAMISENTGILVKAGPTLCISTAADDNEKHA